MYAYDMNDESPKHTTGEEIEGSVTPSQPAPSLEVTPTPDVIKFDIGQMVYHRLDPYGSPGLIMGLIAQPGHYKYFVRWERLKDAMHFDFELSLKPCLREVRHASFDEDDDDD